MVYKSQFSAGPSGGNGHGSKLAFNSAAGRYGYAKRGPQPLYAMKEGKEDAIVEDST